MSITNCNPHYSSFTNCNPHYSSFLEDGISNGYHCPLRGVEGVERAGLLNLRPSLLLLVFHGRFWHQLEVTQRTHKFGVRLFSGVAHSVDRRVVAILGPRNGFGDVGVSKALGPFAIDVQFHLPSLLTVSCCAGCYLTQLNTKFKKRNKVVAILPFGKCRGRLSSHEQPPK